MRGRTWHAGDRRRSRIGSARDRLGPVGWAGGTDPARLKPFATRASVMDRGGAGQLDRARPVLLASRVSTVHSGLSRRADVGSWFVAEPRLDVVGQRVAAIGRVELRQHLGPTHLVEVEDRAILGSGSSQLPVPVLAVPIVELDELSRHVHGHVLGGAQRYALEQPPGADAYPVLGGSLRDRDAGGRSPTARGKRHRLAAAQG